jgi:NTF2 fold immunity protein
MLCSCQRSPDYRYNGAQSEPLNDIELSYKPSTGYVRTPGMAAKIAEIFGQEYYGQKIMEEQKPLLVTRAKEMWIVKGSRDDDPNVKGGVFEIRISSDNGMVLGMIHGK